MKECIQLAVSAPDPMLTELVELIESGPLDLELQRRTAMAAGQRHQQGIEQDERVTLGFDLLRQFVPAFNNRTPLR